LESTSEGPQFNPILRATSAVRSDQVGQGLETSRYGDSRNFMANLFQWLHFFPLKLFASCNHNKFLILCFFI